MLFAQELQHLSELLRISAETIVRIARARGLDEVQLNVLAMEIDLLADRLMRIGLRSQQTMPS